MKHAILLMIALAGFAIAATADADNWYGWEKQQSQTHSSGLPRNPNIPCIGCNRPPPVGNSSTKPNARGGYNTSYENGARCSSTPNARGGYNTTCW